MPKKPKLTPEEKKQKKLEKKKQAAEQKLQLKRDYLEREIQYSNLTLKENEKKWRKMLIKIALPRMKAELEFAWHNFERVIDCKDFTISLLMDEVVVAEDQYMMNFKNHSENIDKLIKFFDDRLHELRDDYENEVGDMMKRNEREIENINVSANEFEEYMKTMLYGLAMDKREQEELYQINYVSRLDENKNKFMELIEGLKANLELKFNSIYSETVNFIKDFHKRTDKRKEEHDTKKNADFAMQVVLRQQLNLMMKYNNKFKKLKQIFKDKHTSEGRELSDLINERKYFRDAFWELKNSLQTNRQKDYEKLMIMSELSNATFDNLEHLIKKGETILTVSTICRKFETQVEKILPFPVPPIDFRKKKILDKLFLFWRRMGQVNASKHAIKEERAHLCIENYKLKELVTEYCKKMNTSYNKKLDFKKFGTMPRTDGNDLIRKYEKFYK